MNSGLIKSKIFKMSFRTYGWKKLIFLTRLNESL